MIDLWTLVSKEVINFLRLWKQTLVPVVITIVLYILIFGKFIWSKISIVPWVSYMEFIFPGLLMMAVITWSYALTSFGFFSAKMFKQIEELLVSPITNNKIIIWYALAWMTRWLIVWLIVFILGLFFMEIHIFNYAYLFLFTIFTSILFSLAWLLNWIFARSFDDINIIPSFIITPLIYLWWVFYSINMLSPFWQTLSQFNPILYMINGLRYAFIWITDVNIYFAISILLFFITILYLYILYLLKHSKGIRS